MKVHVESSGAKRKMQREIKKILKKNRSVVARAINKEITAGRKMIVEDMMTKTGLKRKTINDRMPITRANPNKGLTGKITPIYGERIYMNLYPWVAAIARGSKKVIKLLSPIYRKNMRTGFMSADGTRMYLRHESEQKGVKRYYVRAVRGRSVPRLFDELKMKDRYQHKIIERVMNAVKGVLLK